MPTTVNDSQSISTITNLERMRRIHKDSATEFNQVSWVINIYISLWRCDGAPRWCESIALRAASRERERDRTIDRLTRHATRDRYIERSIASRAAPDARSIYRTIDRLARCARREIDTSNDRSPHALRQTRDRYIERSISPGALAGR